MRNHVRSFPRRRANMATNWSEKCRVCLKEDEEKRNIFAEFDDGITLLDIFTSTTCFEISKEDGLSHFMCKNCTNIVVDFYHLKKIYQKNEKQIKALLLSSDELVKDDCNPNKEETTIENAGTVSPGNTKNTLDGYYPEIKLEVAPDTTEEKDVNRVDPGVHHQTETTLETTDEESTIIHNNCLQCNETFLSCEDLEKHVRIKHKKLQKKAKTTKNRINSKKRRKTADEKPKEHKTLVCHVCGKSFARKWHLKVHLDVHLDQRTHVCEICNKTFQTKGVLITHRKLHTHPHEELCTICGKSFTYRNNLNSHIKLVHTKILDLSCMICGAKFNVKATLEDHMKRHQERQKEFRCEECPSEYRDKRGLKRHIREKHSATYVKPVCDLCGKQFPCSGHLKRHLKDVHKIIINSKKCERKGKKVKIVSEYS